MKVNPEALKTKSGEIESEIKTLRGHIEEIQNIVGKTNGYWTGISGDKARTEFNSQKDSLELVLKRFSEHPVDLQKMAGIYIDAESDIKAENEALATDVII